MKKMWKRFWTLNNHRAGGFTLVELIVVIAILAILAGVGTAGYSGYIKSSNKNADKVLVGNIIRAIETGTNSQAFVSDDSFKMGSISYPVGIVVISADGTTVISSKTPQANANVGDCKFQTITVSYPVQSGEAQYCETDTNKTKKVYKWENQIYTCCVTHTDWLSAGAATDKPFSYEKHTCEKQEICGTTTCSSYTATATYLVAENGYYVGDRSDICTASSQAGLCQVGYANQYGTFETPRIEDAYIGDPIYDSLVAAFGDLDGLKLTYDKWNTDDGFGYATFYTGADSLMESLESMAGTLALFSGNATVAERLGLSTTYGSTDEILTGVSDNLITAYGSTDAMLDAWNNDENMTWDSYGFHVSGRENYSAMRASYNNAFASYLDANGQSTYSDAIRNYSKSVAGVNISMPLLVCSNAFTDGESGLQDQLDCTDEEFEQLAQLYQKYVDSGACSENGSLVYDVLETVDSTADVANAYKDMHGTSVYDYYNSYVNELSAMYSEAQNRADDGIVIIVTAETVDDQVQLNFQVSPGAASPRND